MRKQECTVAKELLNLSMPTLKNSVEDDMFIRKHLLSGIEEGTANKIGFVKLTECPVIQ